MTKVAFVFVAWSACMFLLGGAIGTWDCAHKIDQSLAEVQRANRVVALDREAAMKAANDTIAEYKAQADACEAQRAGWTVIAEPDGADPRAQFAGAMFGAVAGGKFSGVAGALSQLTSSPQ